MDRTFQSKVDKWYWLVLAIFSFFLFYCFWMHFILFAIMWGMVVVFLIEMLVHTQYVITASGTMRIESGRFVHNREVLVKSVCSVRWLRSWSVFKPALSVDCLEIRYKEKGAMKKVYVSPKNRNEFIRCLSRHNPDIRIVID